MTASSIVPLSVLSMRDGRITVFQGSLLTAQALPSTVLTILRIPVAALGVVLLLFGAPLPAAFAFVTFAVVDYFDGAVARASGADGPRRRGLDVIVDRAAIHSAAFTCVLLFDEALSIAILLLARDVIQGAYSLYVLKRFRTILVGPRLHMLYGITFLVWGLYFIFVQSTNGLLTAVLCVVSVTSLIDYVIRGRTICLTRKG